ncbi:MAG: 4-hydroxyphenylacetate 3-hydroxylase N-terminal domain-containing protein [Syntrophomonadaceae bacterium]|nr:4-hydroxyphenylacetate 3-hydroxylase N-terminal domain-containing protein [Syntrophomonadaceae bacterium]
MRTSAEYFERLAKMRPNIYLEGEKIGRDHPTILKGGKTLAKTFDLVNDPKYERVLTATSHYNGEKINRFNHLHQNAEDLLLKQEMNRVLSSLVGGCIQRCMGIDALNALSVTTKNADMKYGTNYHERFNKFMQYFQAEDLVGCAAQTDSKGDRRLRPSQQPDPDAYLHVVERREDGVVVRGAKLHNTAAQYADEIIAFPTRAIGKDEPDYAIAFAIPADTEGIYLLTRVAAPPERIPELHVPYSDFIDTESFTVFDNVFVPNERIFINGETEFGSETALLFALFHRHGYCGCKPGLGDMLTGLAALVADYNGVEKVGHVKDKLADIMSVGELVYAAGIAASVKSMQSPAGTYIPNIMYANVGRRHAGVNIYHEMNIIADLAGGIPITLPQTKEYANPEISEFLLKYNTRRAGVSPLDHYKAMMFASDVMASEMTGLITLAGVHGGGSPQMEDIAILASGNIEEKKNIAKHLAGIEY